MLDAHGSVIKFAVDISRKVVAGGSEFTSNARKLCWKMAASRHLGRKLDFGNARNHMRLAHKYPPKTDERARL